MDEYPIMYTHVDDSFRFSALLRFYDFLKSWPGVTITSLSLFSSPFAERFCVYVFHFSFNIFNIVLSFEFRVSTVTNFHCILLFATVRDFVFCCLQLWLARILLFATVDGAAGYPGLEPETREGSKSTSNWKDFEGAPSRFYFPLL